MQGMFVYWITILKLNAKQNNALFVQSIGNVTLMFMHWIRCKNDATQLSTGFLSTEHMSNIWHIFS